MGSVLMITGSYPPEICGVGDYTKNIMDTKLAREWDIYHRADWKISDIFNIIREIGHRNANRIFLQYPTQGYGWSVVPHIICLYFSLFCDVRFALVLHEYSQLSLKARASVIFMLLFSREIIFTNEFELRRAAVFRKFGWQISRVIKIASNIPALDDQIEISNRRIDVAYFGHLRPKKGIEYFVEVAAAMRARGSQLTIALIGQVPNSFQGFAETIIRECEDLNIEVYVNLDINQVAQLLSQTKIAYLPFPDGVSERRGTAFAAMANGAIVLTTKGDYMTPDLSAAVTLTSPINAEASIREILDSPEAAMKSKQDCGFAYINNSLPADWEHVAQCYLDCLEGEGDAAHT